MDVDDVGRMRFCPACGRPLMAPQYESEDQDSDSFDCQEPRCSCCERPWIACPCTPAEEGSCRSIREIAPKLEKKEAKTKEQYQQAVDEIAAICKKHGVFLLGTGDSVYEAITLGDSYDPDSCGWTQPETVLTNKVDFSRDSFIVTGIGYIAKEIS